MAYEDVRAQLHGRDREKIANNTWLDCYDVVEKGDGALIKMSLHGNTIAYFTTNYINLFSTGWRTNTTKNRLNLALAMAKIPIGTRIYQRNWDWYLCCLTPEANAPYLDVPFFDGIRVGYDGSIIK